MYTVIYNGDTDPTAWFRHKSEINHGAVGPFAFARTPRGVAVLGRKADKISGFMLLTGIDYQLSSDKKVLTESISEHIEPDILALPSTYWDDAYGISFNNRSFFAITTTGTYNNRIYVWDWTRKGTSGQPGAWSLWSGINAKCLFIHNGLLYAGDSTDTGYVRQLFSGTYDDSGTAIDSYFWSAEIGGDPRYRDNMKSWRRTKLSYGALGNWDMNVNYRTVGSLGSGSSIEVDLSPGGSQYGTAIYGTSTWGGGVDSKETLLSIGTQKAAMIQFGFDNQNVAGQAFKVFWSELYANVKSER